MRFVLAVCACLFLGVDAYAEDPFSTSVTIRNHRFEPPELHVPAGRRIILHLKNDDPLSEEFDSVALKVEKVFSGKSEGVIRIGPLESGRYEFMGEYHSDSAKGLMIAE
jgi:hypothetical protein